MKIKTLICNCKGLCPSFENTDMNTLPFEIESRLDVDYAIVHPQLCGMGGTRVMEDVLRSAESDSETLVIVGACELSSLLPTGTLASMMLTGSPLCQKVGR